MSGRMTRSRSRNAAMDMPSLQPQAFHGYAGYAPAAGTARPSAGQQSSWDRYIPHLKLEVHHGRAVAALSGINPDERTGHRPVVLVRAEHPHSLLPDAHFQLEVIVISLRGYTTSTSESTTLMIGHSRPTKLSLNIFKTLKDITYNNKRIMKPPWNYCGSSIRTLKHSTSTTGITLHPVSKLAWGGWSPRR